MLAIGRAPLQKRGWRLRADIAARQVARHKKSFERLESGMPIQITGLISQNSGTQFAPADPEAFELDALQSYARVHEDAGFDRVLVANTATMPDSIPLGTYVAGITTRLGLMMAHRPGFVAPTMAARMLATVDRVSSGRAGVHIIAGASDLELQADGDFLTKEQRYARAAEYVGVMRKVWSSAEPFDHEGEFYRFKGAHALVRPAAGSIPVFWGGESDLAIEMAGRCCDIYAILSNTVAGAAAFVSKANAAAARANRKLDVLMTMGVVLGDTEAEAWANADALLDRIAAARGAASAPKPDKLEHEWAKSNAFKRIAEQAQQSERLDTRLWTGVNRLMAGRGNHNALVGTPEQVVDALIDYYRVGVSRFLLRGFNPLRDAERMGRELLPSLRQSVAEVDHDACVAVDTPPSAPRSRRDASGDRPPAPSRLAGL